MGSRNALKAPHSTGQTHKTTPSSAQPPLQQPTLRLQGEDIILEDGAAMPLDAHHPPITNHAPNDAIAPVASLATPPEKSRHTTTTTINNNPTDAGNHPVTAAAAVGASEMVKQKSDATSPALEPTRLAGSAKRSGLVEGSNGGLGSHRLRFDPESPGLGGVLGAGGGSSAAKCALTADNVAHFRKQQSGTSAESKTDRMWKWLEESGPPFDAQPSVGVLTRPGGGPPTLPTIAHGNGGDGRRGLLRRLFCLGWAPPPR
jgi:hypothetical protein